MAVAENDSNPNTRAQSDSSEREEVRPGPSSLRIAGLDLARGIAVLNMIIINFVFTMAGDPGGLMYAITYVSERPFACAFVMLAGVGVSLAGSDPQRIPEVRVTVLRRALFFILLGYSWIPIWDGDILHFFGFYMAIGCIFLARPSSWLWHVSGWCVAGFVALYVSWNYWYNWDMADLAYYGFWTPMGQLRNLLFNGFHPLLPWLGFYLVGMWLGRQKLADPRVRWRLGLVGFEVFAISFVLSLLILDRFDANLGDLLEYHPYLATLRELFSTELIPPSPFFVMSAGGFSVAFIMACLWIAERAPRAVWPLVATGQLAFTLYMGHILLGIWPLEDTDEGMADPEVFLRVGAFIVGSVIFSVLWRRFFARGPLEWVMRRLCG